mgnify:CR=1 FL=1|tara:strand:+ start:801 stop:1223 length:423 start_codon:yes stop_codon:yes gene_type:complete
MGSLLALDFGEKRTGIAHTDSLQIIASALTTLSPEETIIFLKDYKINNDLDAVIIGQSKKSDGSYPIIEKKILNFIYKLNNMFPGLKIIRYDERFSSKIAKRTLLKLGLSKSKRRDKKLIDKMSATIILQSYLESTKDLK